jgi:hypothetical protein
MLAGGGEGVSIPSREGVKMAGLHRDTEKQKVWCSGWLAPREHGKPDIRIHRHTEERKHVSQTLRLNPI